MWILVLEIQVIETSIDGFKYVWYSIFPLENRSDWLYFQREHSQGGRMFSDPVWLGSGELENRFEYSGKPVIEFQFSQSCELSEKQAIYED